MFNVIRALVPFVCAAQLACNFKGDQARIEHDRPDAAATRPVAQPQLLKLREEFIARLTLPRGIGTAGSWQDQLDRYTTGLQGRDGYMNKLADIVMQDRGSLQVLVVESLYQQGTNPYQYERIVVFSEKGQSRIGRELEKLDARRVGNAHWPAMVQCAEDLIRTGGGHNGFDIPFLHQTDVVLLTYFDGRQDFSGTWLWFGEARNLSAKFVGDNDAAPRFAPSLVYAKLLKALRSAGELFAEFGNPDAWQL